MGYRSDVTILFYGDEKYFPILKLWVETNLMPELKAQGGLDCLREFARGTLRGYALEYTDVKWYPNNDSVRKIEEIKGNFVDVFVGNEVSPLGLEWARVGEDYADVSVDGSAYIVRSLLDVKRCIEY